jgi:hypothetical protein
MFVAGFNRHLDTFTYKKGRLVKVQAYMYICGKLVTVALQ